MVQTSQVKFYVAKYLFLVCSILQWILAGIIFLRFHNSNEGFLISFTVFILLGILLYLIFVSISQRVKQVALGKNKIIVMEGAHNFRFEWPEIKSARLIPFLNLYTLRIRGWKKTIFFFPARKLDQTYQLPLENS